MRSNWCKIIRVGTFDVLIIRTSEKRFFSQKKDQIIKISINLENMQKEITLQYGVDAVLANSKFSKFNEEELKSVLGDYFGIYL